MENMNYEVQTTGYWGTSSAALTNFEPGVYAVVPVMSGVRW